MVKLAIVSVCLLLAACEIQRAQTAKTAQAQLVGSSAEQILACMGPPAQTAVVGSTEVWSYSSGDNRTTVSYTGSLAVGRTRHCTVNIVMVDRRVSSVNYLGPSGGLLTGGEQCAFAVEGCVR